MIVNQVMDTNPLILQNGVVYFSDMYSHLLSRIDLTVKLIKNMRDSLYKYGSRCRNFTGAALQSYGRL
jgi:hypothetical protein